MDEEWKLATIANIHEHDIFACLKLVYMHVLYISAEKRLCFTTTKEQKKKLSKQYNLYQNDLWKKNLSLGQSNKFSVCHFRFAWIFLNKKIILIVYHFDLTTKATQFTTNLQESNIKTTNDAKILFTLGYKLLLSVIYFVFFFLLCFALCACAHCFTIRWRYSVIALPSSFR